MRKFILIIAVTAGLFGGCSPARDTFYWGDYSSTLYELKKNPTEASLAEHKKQLLSIIDISQKKNKQVPPGIYAEYGYILLKAGSEAEGMEYLDKEISLYPESTIFINRLKAEYERGKK